MSEKDPPKIRDIARFKKMREGMKGFKLIKILLLLGSPLLKILGIKTKDMKEALKELPKIEREFMRLSELPDKFNDAFSSRGWIIYDFLNIEVAENALEIAKEDIEKAEKYLVDYYTPEVVEAFLRTMLGVQAFRCRMSLAEKALIDYREERYHACVPLILALMDGLVNELNKKQNRSFFTDESDLRAWDCITAHEKGLNALKEVTHAGRYKTTTEEISIPYRNGILHGMDLGFANKTVAAKTWAALFAVRDWAIKVESGELEKPPSEPKTTWSGLYQKIKDYRKNQVKWEELFNNWKPRILLIGEDVSRYGDITDYQEGTPERKVVEFLLYWRKRNYGFMAKCLESNFRTPVNNLARQLRERYQENELISFEILAVRDEAPAISEVDVRINYKQNNEILEKVVVFRVLIYEGENNPTIFSNPNAEWFIMNWIIV